jgi:hypothetical protein
LIEMNVVGADVMVPPFDFIDHMIQLNHWTYLNSCFGVVYPKLVRDFYGYMRVVHDGQNTLSLQTTVQGVPITNDPELIGQIIGVQPTQYEGIPFPNSVDPPSMEELQDFSIPQHPERISNAFKIGLFSMPHRLLAKIILYNL